MSSTQNTLSPLFANNIFFSQLLAIPYLQLISQFHFQFSSQIYSKISSKFSSISSSNDHNDSCSYRCKSHYFLTSV